MILDDLHLFISFVLDVVLTDSPLIRGLTALAGGNKPGSANDHTRYSGMVHDLITDIAQSPFFEIHIPSEHFDSLCYGHAVIDLGPSKCRRLEHEWTPIGAQGNISNTVSLPHGYKGAMQFFIYKC